MSRVLYCYRLEANNKTKEQILMLLNKNRLNKSVETMNLKLKQGASPHQSTKNYNIRIKSRLAVLDKLSESIRDHSTHSDSSAAKNQVASHDKLPNPYTSSYVNTTSSKRCLKTNGSLNSDLGQFKTSHASMDNINISPVKTKRKYKVNKRYFKQNYIQPPTNVQSKNITPRLGNIHIQPKSRNSGKL
jgi:hypothetical protein